MKPTVSHRDALADGKLDDDTGNIPESFVDLASGKSNIDKRVKPAG